MISVRTGIDPDIVARWDLRFLSTVIAVLSEGDQ